MAACWKIWDSLELFQKQFASTGFTQQHVGLGVRQSGTGGTLVLLLLRMRNPILCAIESCLCHDAAERVDFPDLDECC